MRGAWRTSGVPSTKYGNRMVRRVDKRTAQAAAGLTILLGGHSTRG